MENYTFKGRLAYNKANDRYGLLFTDEWCNEGYQVGDSLTIQVNGEWIDTTMEKNSDGEWYLTDTPYHGDLDTVVVKIK